MFGATNIGIDIDGVSDGYVTVSLTAARAETLMGLQGRFAAADATGNLNLVSVSAANAVRGMVVGDLSGGGFVLSGSGVEVAGAILTATYRVNAGAAAGNYSLPITIDAAMVDGVPVEDEVVTATVNVAMKAVVPEPVATQPTQNTTPVQNATSAENAETSQNVSWEASAGEATNNAGMEEQKSEMAAGESSTKGEQAGTLQKVASGSSNVPSANKVLSATTTTENIVAGGFDPVGIIAVVAVAAMMGAAILIAVVLAKKKKSALRNGR